MQWRILFCVQRALLLNDEAEEEASRGYMFACERGAQRRQKYKYIILSDYLRELWREMRLLLK